MKVLLRIRSDVDRFPGGDYVQLLKTRDALERLGVTTSIAPGIQEIDDGFDVVHLFNTTRLHETAVQFEQARRRGLPVVVSPIWHSLAEMQRSYRHLYHLPLFPINAYLGVKEAWYAWRSGLPAHFPSIVQPAAVRSRVLAGARAVLPNSQVERRVLERETGVMPAKVFIIPYGFDSSVTKPVAWPERHDVICAGRIEPRKNQLAVIKAFKSLQRTTDKLLLYGSWNASHARYEAKVRAALVPGWVEYGGNLPQPELHVAFSRAKAVILASFFETFGLVALEGMACGSRVCVSSTDYTRSIFEDWVQYCDPFSVASIRAGLVGTLGGPPRDYTPLLSRFTWEEAARKTLEAYEYAVGT